MEQRTVQNKEELHFLIVTIISNKQNPFTLAEIVEEVICNKVFNNFCSTVELAGKVSEAMDLLFELGVIKGETEFPENNNERFTVTNIT